MKYQAFLCAALSCQLACAVSSSEPLPRSAEAVGASPDGPLPDLPASDEGDAAAGADGGTPDASEGGGEPSLPGSGTAMPTPGGPCGPDLCEDGSGSGSSCEQAITMGRARLLSGSAEYQGSTEASGATQDLSQPDCKDEGKETFYRVYLYPGEVLNLSIRNRTTERDISVKFYFSRDCVPPTPAMCFDGGGAGVSELVYEQPALGEGFHYIVVDGPTGAGTKFSISQSSPFVAAEGACSC